MAHLRPLVDCVRRGEAFARGGLGTNATSWTRPWTYVDTIFLGGALATVVAIGALWWAGPARHYSRRR